MPHDTTTATKDAWTAFPARPAGQSDRDRHGFAKALTTDAGRAWLKLLDERKDRALSVVSSQYAVTGRWPAALAVPEAAADDVARAAVHGDSGLGQSLLGLV